MKKLLFSAIMITFVMTSCKKTEESPATTVVHKDTTVVVHDTVKEETVMEFYACPMHPEVQGKLNDKCPKCGMDLTEKVPQ